MQKYSSQSLHLVGFIMAILFLSACSPNQILENVGLIGKDDDKVDEYSCPNSYIPDYYTITLTTTRAVPAKLALVLDGKLKFDECLAEPILTDEAPIVELSHSNGKVDILARWLDPKNLPHNISYELLDRGDCSVAPSTFYLDPHVYLLFEKAHYGGDQRCGGYNKAHTEIVD